MHVTVPTNLTVTPSTVLVVVEVTADASVVVFAGVELEIVPDHDVECVRQRDRPMSSAVCRCDDAAGGGDGAERTRHDQQAGDAEQHQSLAQLHAFLPVMTEAFVLPPRRIASRNESVLNVGIPFGTGREVPDERWKSSPSCPTADAAHAVRQPVGGEPPGTIRSACSYGDRKRVCGAERAPTFHRPSN